MADDKNKKKKTNSKSVDKLALSLKSTKLSMNKPGSSSTTNTAFTLAISQEDGKILLNLNTASSVKQPNSQDRQSKATTGPKSSTSTGKPQHTPNNVKKNHPQKFAPNIPKTNSNTGSGQKKSATSNFNVNTNTGPKHSPNVLNAGQSQIQHANKTSFNANSVPRNVPHHFKHPHFNTGYKNFNHALNRQPKIHPYQNQTSPFPAYSNNNFETNVSKESFNSSHMSMSQSLSNLFFEDGSSQPALKSPANCDVFRGNSPAPVNTYKNFNRYGVGGSLSKLHGSWSCGLDEVQKQTEEKTFLKEHEQSQPRFTHNEAELNCPTCRNIYLPQIFQCASGHSSCSSCKDMGLTCGICGQGITDMRNFALEAYLADKKVPCPHNTEGCKLVIRTTEIGDHTKECPFGMLECPAGCLNKMPIKQLSDHFEEHHPGQRLACVGSDIELLYNAGPTQKLYLVKLGAYNFLIHERVSGRDNLIYIAVQLIGTKPSASKWFYEVHVYSKFEPYRICTYSEI